MTHLNKWSTVSEDRFCSIFPFPPSTPLLAPSVHVYPLSPHFPSPPTSVLGWLLDKLTQFVLPAKKVHTHSFTTLSSAILISWGALLFSNKHQSQYKINGCPGPRGKESLQGSRRASTSLQLLLIHIRLHQPLFKSKVTSEIATSWHLFKHICAHKGIGWTDLVKSSFSYKIIQSHFIA